MTNPENKPENKNEQIKSVKEIDSFIKMSPNDFIRDKWKEVCEKLKALPVNRDTYGFIHNDNHQMNIIATESDIAVIDFDCAECHFFINFPSLSYCFTSFARFL